MAKTPEENLIHLRFTKTEAINAKKHILSSEINMLKISQKIKNYKKLRAEELRKKEKIAQKLKSVKVDLKKLHKILPKLKIPKILEPKESLKVPKTKEQVEEDVKIKRYGTIEQQLLQIQNKLKALGHTESS